jgi:hypothetical protein
VKFIHVRPRRIWKRLLELQAQCVIKGDFGSLADLFTDTTSTSGAGGKADINVTLILAVAPECLLSPKAVIQIGEL